MGNSKSEIHMGEFEHAVKNTLVELKASILKREKDHSHYSELDQMYERAALLHYSLFIYFNRGGFEEIVGRDTGLFREQRYLQAVSTICPHLLRYMVMAVILLNDSRDDPRMQRTELHEIAAIVQEETSSYKDSLPEFLRLLWVENDFDGAAECFKDCQRDVNNDFFLSYYLDVFNDAARLIILKQYCRLYSRIRVSELCKYLLFTDEVACMKFVTRKVQ